MPLVESAAEESRMSPMPEPGSSWLYEETKREYFISSRGHDLLEFVRLFHRVGHEEREIFLFSAPGLRAVLRLYCHFEECVQIFLLVRRAVRNEVVSPDEGVHPLMNDEAKYIETCGSAIARLKSGAPYFPLGGK